MATAGWKVCLFLILVTGPIAGMKVCHYGKLPQRHPVVAY